MYVLNYLFNIRCMNRNILVTGLVPEELLPLLLKEAAAENGEDGKKTEIDVHFLMTTRDEF